MHPSLSFMFQDLIDKRKKLMKEFREFRMKSQQAFRNKCKKFPECKPWASCYTSWPVGG